MVTSPTGNGVIVIGGKTDSGRGSRSNEMYEMSEGKTTDPFFPLQWKKLDQKLQYGRVNHMAIPIPEELICEKPANFVQSIKYVDIDKPKKKQKAKAKTKAKIKAKAKAKTKAKAKSKAKAKPNAKTKAKAKSNVKTKAKPKTKVNAKEKAAKK